MQRNVNKVNDEPKHRRSQRNLQHLPEYIQPKRRDNNSCNIYASRSQLYALEAKKRKDAEERCIPRNQSIYNVSNDRPHRYACHPHKPKEPNDQPERDILQRYFV